jgi:CHAT domain-containing protein
MRKELKKENRQAFIESEKGTAVGLVDLLIKQKQPQKAYEWANLVTTYELADYNRLINAKVANPEAQKAIDEWKQRNQQIDVLRGQLRDNFTPEKARQIQNLEAESFKQGEQIAKTYPEVAELFEINPTDIDQLSQNIPADTLVIQPVLLTGTTNVSNTVAIFLLTNKQFKVIQTSINPEEMDKLIRDYKTQLEDYQSSAYLDTSSKLYDILIRPIENDINALSPQKIAFITTGNLRGIPVETLYDEQSDQYLLAQKC